MENVRHHASQLARLLVRLAIRAARINNNQYIDYAENDYRMCINDDEGVRKANRLRAPSKIVGLPHNIFRQLRFSEDILRQSHSLWNV